MPVGSKKTKSPRRKDAAPSLEVGGFFAPITTFAPEPYELRRTLAVVVQREGEGFVATFFDANLHASGDTEEEAFRNLKSLILDVFESLQEEPPERLGPEPKRQLAVLEEFIQAKN